MKANDPYVLLLVGLPLSGKTFYIKKNYPDTKVISRDDLVMEVYGSDNYSEAFKNVNQKEVDRLLDLRLKDANLNKENVIVDMTNLSPKRRKQTLFLPFPFKKLVLPISLLSLVTNSSMPAVNLPGASPICPNPLSPSCPNIRTISVNLAAFVSLPSST